MKNKNPVPHSKEPSQVIIFGTIALGVLFAVVSIMSNDLSNSNQKEVSKIESPRSSSLHSNPKKSHHDDSPSIPKQEKYDFYITSNRPADLYVDEKISFTRKSDSPISSEFIWIWDKNLLECFPIESNTELECISVGSGTSEIYMTNHIKKSDSIVVNVTDKFNPTPSPEIPAQKPLPRSHSPVPPQKQPAPPHPAPASPAN